MTSLAAQLLQNASLNSALLVDRSRRKPRESYLFTGREADSHDLDTLHALGVNGLIQLSTLDPSLRAFEDDLFSDRARSTDRTLLSTEANAKLNKIIGDFLPLLGQFLLEPPTNKVLEWLVRRFRIHEFNVEDVFALFLPYHETPHFAKMLTILHIKPNSTWSFLLPFKAATQSVPRMPLVIEMIKNTDVARFISSLLPSSLKHNHVHRTLVAFNAACLDDFINRSKSLDEGTVAYLLPAILQPLQTVDHEFAQESILGSYLLLARFSQKVRISSAAIKVIINAITDAAEHVSARQFLTAAIAILSPQEEQERFSRKASKRILEIPFIIKAARGAAPLVGFEKLMVPLFTGLAESLNDDAVQKLLSSLLTYNGTPKAVLKHISKLVLQRVVSSDTPPENLRDLLYSIYQRHPPILQRSSDELIDSDEAMKPAVQQALVSLSLEAQAPSKDINNRTQDAVVASTVAESNVRAIAVKEMIEKLSVSESLTQSEQESIHSALIVRVQDTETEVLEALYEKPDVITPLLLKNANAYIDALVLSFRSFGSKPKRNILKLHLSFLAKHFNTKADNHVIASVFHSIFFPFLLFSKARQRTAEMVWDIIEEGMPDAESSTYELLHGCAAIVHGAKGKSEDSIQTMSEINSNVASQMARSILMSNDYAVHFETFVTKLQVDDPHAQAFAYLIIHALIQQLSGEHQVNAALKVLEVLGRDVCANLASVALDSDKALESLDGVELARHTVIKPSSKSTLPWLQLAIVAAIPSITPPSIALDWTADLDFTPMDLRGRHYVELMRKVYFIINTTSLPPPLIMTLLHVLFERLGHDSLAFLAGIWSGVDKAAKDQNQLRAVALQHASAYLQSRVEANVGMDYQTVLPLLLVALSSPSVLLRRGALTCLSLLQAITENPFKTVYKFDAVYGANEGQLQYLEQADLKKYLAGLSEEGDHLLHDHTFVHLFHGRHLKKNKSGKKKENEYRNRVLCYLLSHVRSLSLPTAQIGLLKLLEGISDRAKARILSPIIGTVTSVDKQVYTGAQEELVSLCIATFDSSIASDLNEPQSTMWSLYEAIIRRYFSSGEPSQLRVISSCLEELFPCLSQERKVTLSELILEIGARDPEMYGPSKKLLTNVLADVPLIIHLLGILQPPSIDPSQRSSKRPKIAEDDDNVRRLTLLIEILGTKALPGSLDLISQLLDMINGIARAVSSAQADVSYIEQLLMSAIESAAEKMTGTPKLAPSAIRLDTLVELIRVSDNPQTFHQALLLISKLFPLAAESVLHNVMPVFTFMGSNVFHRDDAYSFKVVQQTIESIVPFMVTSLKKSHAEKLDLYIASRDFLRIFTDAANYIPRHRRNHFFFHLVDILGPADFLAPVIMLVVAKLANRVVRQTSEEAQATLALPIALLQHFSPSLQITALTEILYESQRLVARVIDPNTIQSTLLGDSTNEDKKRAKALINFVGISSASSLPTPGCLAHARSEELSAFTSMLITLASLKAAPTGSIDADDIREAARTSLRHALTAMPAATFVASAVAMLESQDSDVQSGALDLLGERLPMIADNVRQTVTDMVKKVIDWIRTLITSQIDVPVMEPAFRALRSIGSSLQPGEEATISDAVPIILAIIKQEAPIAHVALASLVPLPTKLGPRFIPYLRDTVSICVCRMTAEPAEDARTLLQNLLVVIPTFWGTTEVTEVISTFTKSAPSLAMLGLIRAITKRVPSKVLLLSLLQMWPTYQDATDKVNVGAYFDVMTRALRSAAQPLVLELLRPLVKLFLEALEVVAAAETNPSTENNVISAFKQFVVKLNETTFKPIYRRVYDWGYASDTADIRKRIIFCRLYASLLDFFKGLMTHYMSFLMQPFIVDLEAFSKTTSQDKEYWACILDVTTKSLRLDDGAYWRDDKLRQISKPLIMQLPISIDLGFIEQRQMLQDCFDALVDNTTDDALLKSTNLDILMHTRSEDARVRVFALGCAEVLWRIHGGKLRGFVAETATFIAEGIEDENDLVVKESLKLKNAVESMAGSINDL
ncbi:hypothetical protein JOM56_011440 [Amanita muscaria]